MDTATPRISLILLLPFLIILFPIPNILAIHEFIFIELVVGVVILYHLLRKQDARFNFIDLSIFLFWLFALASSYWSINHSYAFQEFAFFSSSVLLFYYGRIVFGQELYKNVYSKYGLFIFALLFSLLCLVGLNNEIGVYRCSELISGNCNYTTAFGFCTVPFIFYSNINRPLKILSLSVLLSSIFFMGYLASTRGVFVVALIQLLIIAFLFFRKYRNAVIYGSMFSVFLIILIIILAYNNIDVPILNEFGKKFEISRFNNQLLSWRMFSDYPLFGVGAGNWIVNVFNYNLTEFSNNLYYNVLLIQENHNYYTLKLCENGLFSFFLFIPIFLILLKSITEFSNLNQICKACVFVLIAYVIFSIFYRTANSHYYLFSRIQGLGFLSMGVLSRSLFKNSFHSISLSSIILCLSIGSISFLSYWFYSDKKIDNIMKSDSSIPEKIQLIEKAKSVSYSSHRHGIPLDIMIAEMKDSEGLSPIINYEQALQIFPNKPDLLEPFIIYLMNNGFYEEAILESKKLISIRADYNEAIAFILESKYELGRIDDDDVDDLLSQLYSYNYILPYKSMADFLHLQYRKNIFANNSIVDKEARVSISSLFNKYDSELKQIWDSIKSLKGKRKRDTKENRLLRQDFKKLTISIENEINNILTEPQIDVFNSSSLIH